MFLSWSMSLKVWVKYFLPAFSRKGFLAFTTFSKEFLPPKKLGAIDSCLFVSLEEQLKFTEIMWLEFRVGSRLPDSTCCVLFLLIPCKIPYHLCSEVWMRCEWALWYTDSPVYTTAPSSQNPKFSPKIDRFLGASMLFLSHKIHMVFGNLSPSKDWVSWVKLQLRMWPQLTHSTAACLSFTRKGC